MSDQQQGSSEPVQVVVVGCGQIAPVHLEAAQAVPTTIRYVGTLDSDAGRAAALAQDYTLARSYATWADVLADPQVKAVDLCLPHHLHMPFAVQALQAGKHVLVEKPIAMTVAEAEVIIGAAERNGRVLMPVHNWLYTTVVERAREIITQGILGEVYLVEIVGIQDPATVTIRPWLARRGEGGGGVAIAQTIHFLYVVQSLVGDVRRVSAHTSNKAFGEMEAEATLAMALEFADGTLGTVASTFSQGAGSGELRISVYGSQGLLHYRVSSLDIVAPALYGDATLHTAATADPLDPLGFTGVLADFGVVIRQGVRPKVSAEDGLRSLAVVEAAYRAAATGMTVPVLEAVPETPRVATVD